MRPDQVGIIHISIVKIALRLHLRLHGLYDFTLAEDLVIDLDACDLLKGVSQYFGFISVRGNAFGQDVDFHPRIWLGRIDKPFHFGHLLGLAER